MWPRLGLGFRATDAISQPERWGRMRWWWKSISEFSKWCWLTSTQFIGFRGEGTDIWESPWWTSKGPIILCLFVWLDLVALLPSLHALFDFVLLLFLLKICLTLKSTKSSQKSKTRWLSSWESMGLNIILECAFLVAIRQYLHHAHPSDLLLPRPPFGRVVRKPCSLCPDVPFLSQWC